MDTRVKPIKAKKAEIYNKFFPRMIGTPTVPDDKKEELCSKEYKLFCEGGLFATESVSLYGKEMYLLAPPKKYDDEFYAWISYFEDRSWENAGYCTAEGFVWNGKIGCDDFNHVISAAYILAEQYSSTPCYADVDSGNRGLERYAGWLNYLFGEKYTMQNRNLWNLYLAQRQEYPNKKITISDLDKHCIGYGSKGVIPIAPISTQNFLTHETRYYLYFWREDNGISLDGLDGWFAELKERYDRLINSNTELLSGVKLVVSMFDTLNKVNEHYGFLDAFREMFYDFLENSSDRRHQVWWKIFCDLAEENWDKDKINEEKIRQGKSYALFDPKYLPEREKPARAELKGYLGLMANRALREKIFGKPDIQ